MAHGCSCRHTSAKSRTSNPVMLRLTRPTALVNSTRQPMDITGRSRCQATALEAGETVESFGQKRSLYRISKTMPHHLQWRIQARGAIRSWPPMVNSGGQNDHMPHIQSSLYCLAPLGLSEIGLACVVRSRGKRTKQSRPTVPAARFGEMGFGEMGFGETGFGETGRHRDKAHLIFVVL
jgi:hypothetical protein